MTRPVAAICAAVITALGASSFGAVADVQVSPPVVGAGAQDPSQVVPAAPVMPGVVSAPVSHAKFVISVRIARRETARADRLERTLREGPDFEVSLRLAAIVYGQDWRHLERCALSEGARNAERFDRHNSRPNAGGSGAFSSFQFMRGTFLSTPFARLDWTRQDVQAFAAAWMWKSGRRGEWAGAGC